MPTLRVSCKIRQTVPVRVCLRHGVCLACVAIGAAAALVQAQSQPLFPTLSSAPATSQPTSPADQDKALAKARDVLENARRGRKDELPATRQLLLDFIARYPDNPEGLQLLATAYELSPAPADAQNGMTSEDFAPLAKQVWLKVASVASRTAKTPADCQMAESICLGILRGGPDRWPVHLDLGRLYARTQRRSQAIDHYMAYFKNCRNATPVHTDTQARLELAQLYLAPSLSPSLPTKTDHWRLAVEALNDARKDDPVSAEIDACLAWAYQSGAAAAGEEATSNRVDYRKAEVERRRLLTEAVNAINEALRKEPRNPKYLLAKVEYLLAKVSLPGGRNLNDDPNKDLDEAVGAASLAVRVIAEALEQTPGNTSLLAQLSRCYEAFGATLMARIQVNKDDALALGRLMQMARRHIDVEREASLRRLLGQTDALSSDTARNDPAVKALRDEIEKTLQEIQAGAADLPVATRPGS
ncbi:MAG TPA: hypothetical protein PKY77_18065 [Phycisphaerae bacterium]|nr:hypothetical protein [Phycisphaerae bacterium]HRY70241.1 hypothetical protein [Phycisphaerae bacterium]HSA27588.1 hypothetical protein [Phycisphaerae bacterium]